MNLAEKLRDTESGDFRPHFEVKFTRRVIRVFLRDNTMRYAFMRDKKARIC